jgi:hypothetical protein
MVMRVGRSRVFSRWLWIFPPDSTSSSIFAQVLNAGILIRGALSISCAHVSSVDKSVGFDAYPRPAAVSCRLRTGSWGGWVVSAFRSAPRIQALLLPTTAEHSFLLQIRPSAWQGRSFERIRTLIKIFEFKQFITVQSVDLTEMARNGKLDPTIGRDEGLCLLAFGATVLIARRNPTDNTEYVLVATTVQLCLKYHSFQFYLVEQSQIQSSVLHFFLIKFEPSIMQLIGPPGVGKTAILEGLASRIVSKEVPEVSYHHPSVFQSP